jgi:hypothetical protein
MRSKGAATGINKGSALNQALGGTNNTLKTHSTERGGGRPILKKTGTGNRA